MYRFNKSPIKTPRAHFMGRKVDSKIHKKLQRTLNNDFEKEEKGKELILPNFKTYYKAIVIKMVWYSQKNKHRDECHRTEGTEINPYINGN